MKIVCIALFVSALLLTGCGKAADTEKPQAPAAMKQKADTAGGPAVSTSKSMDKRTGDAHSGKYRSVAAKLHRTDQDIEILVPEDVDIGPNRLIEYKEGDDGKYYFVSLIPQ